VLIVIGLLEVPVREAVNQRSPEKVAPPCSRTLSPACSDCLLTRERLFQADPDEVPEWESEPYGLTY
jgi:hypothetical protein